MSALSTLDRLATRGLDDFQRHLADNDAEYRDMLRLLLALKCALVFALMALAFAIIRVSV